MKRKLLTSAMILLLFVASLSIKTNAADTIDARDPEKQSNQWLTNILTFYQYYDYSKNEEMLNAINEKRAEENLAPVVLDKQLTESAMERVAESSLLFNHDRPIGTDCFTIDALSKRENQTKYTNVTQAVNAYMDSDGHRKNIMNPNNKTVGFGFSDDSGNIQIFGEEAHTNTNSIPDYTGEVWRGYNVYVSNDLYVKGLRVDAVNDGSHIPQRELSENTLLNKNGSIQLVPRLMMDTEDHINNPGSLGAPPFSAAGGVWSSSDESVATVELSDDKNLCIVKAVGNVGDSCDIKFTVNKEIDLSVTYHFTIADISINDVTLDLADNDGTSGFTNIKPVINVNPNIEKTVVWKNGDNVGVGETGYIGWNLKSGSVLEDKHYGAYINNCYVEGTVHFINSITALNLSTPQSSIYEGKNTTVSVSESVGNPKFPATETFSKDQIKWSSSNTNVATVDANGNVTGKTAGSAVVTAKWNGNKEVSNSVTITVKSAKDTITASYGYPVYVDHSAKLNVIYTGSNTVSFASSNENVLTIDTDGTMHGGSTGTVRITVSAPNADSVSFYITVRDIPTLTGYSGSYSANGYTYDTMKFSASYSGTDTVKSYIVQKLENKVYQECSNNNQTEFKPNVTSYTTFRAKAVYASGIESMWFNFGLSRSSNMIVSQKPTPAPTPKPNPTPVVKAPGKTKITSISAGKKKLTVKWKKVSGASGYAIYRSTKKGSGFKKVKTITKGSTVKWTNTKLKGKKTYYYKIKSYKKAYGQTKYSGYSSVKSKKTKK